MTAPSHSALRLRLRKPRLGCGAGCPSDFPIAYVRPVRPALRKRRECRNRGCLHRDRVPAARFPGAPVRGAHICSTHAASSSHPSSTLTQQQLRCTTGSEACGGQLRGIIGGDRSGAARALNSGENVAWICMRPGCASKLCMGVPSRSNGAGSGTSKPVSSH